MTLHMIKLVVGLSTIDDFAANQNRYLSDTKSGKANVVTTRQFPKRAEEIIAGGGSLYRVMQNTIMFRQNIIGFEPIEHPERGRLCLIMCDPEIIRVHPTPRRPFQGWRYLKSEDAPLDYHGDNEARGDIQNDARLAEELRAAGLL